MLGYVKLIWRLLVALGVFVSWMYLILADFLTAFILPPEIFGYNSIILYPIMVVVCVVTTWVAMRQS